MLLMRWVCPKANILFFRMKNHLFPVDMSAGFLAKQFLEGGMVTYFSIYVIWRESGLASPKWDAQQAEHPGTSHHELEL